VVVCRSVCDYPSFGQGQALSLHYHYDILEVKVNVWTWDAGIVGYFGDYLKAGRLPKMGC